MTLIFFQDYIYWLQKTTQGQGFMGLEERKSSNIYCPKTEKEMDRTTNEMQKNVRNQIKCTVK